MTQGQLYAKELDMEVEASRGCLERMKPELYDWKPHEKSMIMGYLALLVADMPRWISYIIDPGVVDFQTYPRFESKETADLLKLFDENVAKAKEVLETVTDERLSETFFLKNGDTELSKDRKDSSISSTLNHWVHHRGQLTVYMRLNGIPVPSIYGPSADDNRF